MISAKEITPVIMVGGPVSRFDLFSGAGRPKPLIKLFASHSPFQQTILRALPFQKPVIVCHERFYANAQQQLVEIGVDPECIILEPVQRGTLTALALASLHLKTDNKMMVVMPCIASQSDTYQDILNAAIYAEQRLVLLGRKQPKHKKATGYITADHQSQELCKPVWAYRDAANNDKSDANQSAKVNEHAIRSTGFILCRPRTYLDILARLEPETYKACERSYFSAEKRKNAYHVNAQNFLGISQTRRLSLAIDATIGDKSSCACVVEIKE